MRYFLLAFLALPALAQSPGVREIGFKCEKGVCFMLEEDWKWVMESMQAKDEAIEKMRTKCGWTKS